MSGNKVFTMKEACEEVDLPYETLKFYCKKELIPSVKRDKNNHRVFDAQDIAWIKDLLCLKRCGMSIAEMQQILDLCAQGPSTVAERKALVEKKRTALIELKKQIQKSIDFADDKIAHYEGYLDGTIPYHCNLP